MYAKVEFLFPLLARKESSRADNSPVWIYVEWTCSWDL